MCVGVQTIFAIHIYSWGQKTSPMGKMVLVGQRLGLGRVN